MIIRVISAVLGILILVLALSGPYYVFNTVIFIIAITGLSEYFKVLKTNSPLFKWIGFVTAVPLMFFYNVPDIFYFSIFLLVLGSFSLVIFNYSKNNVRDVFVTVLGTIFVSFFLSHILKVRELENGNLLIWLILLSAWATDTFAYFFGIRFGKHKLTPISPKKSVEGAIAGLIACIVTLMIYGYYIQVTYNIPYPLYNYLFMGIAAGTISQIGDLAASMLKRSVNEKDYGNIMPGHGGILDRFDSVLFSAPVIYYYLSLFMNLS